VSRVTSGNGVISGTVACDGADIYYEQRGAGPPLLMIAGGGGDCGAYAGLADILAADYTVLTYDRRGNSRSPLHRPPALITMAEQSRDAVAVLRAAGFESARVFGNSGGATIALDLAAYHPQAVGGVIAHEPPLPTVLPDAARYLAEYDEIARVLEAEGWQAAFRLFQLLIGHLPADAQARVTTVLLEPAKVLRPGPRLDLMQRLSHNWEYLVRFEIQPFIHYEPDLDRIAAAGTPVALAAGVYTIALARSEDLGRDPRHRPAVAIADRLGAEFAEFPGGHQAPLEIPGPFAAALRALFERMAL
jgi:pimeloyl-ACP methyl ester carboxylesterase